MTFGMGILVVILLLGGAGILQEILQNRNKTRIEIAKLHLKQEGSEGLRQELTTVREEETALRRQMESLRDTTTQYDISFDTALQRMESRVNHIEQQNKQQQTQQQRIGV